MLLRQFYEHKLSEYRSRIDARLNQIIAAEEDPHIQEMLKFALENGRRFRPLLFLLSYKVLGREIDSRAYELATAIELLHKASLLHDDLVDGDGYRRARPTFCNKFGMARTVILGDLLVAEASLRFTRSAGLRLTELWLEQYRKLCYGEILDVIGVDGERNRERAERIIYGKTASFLEFIFRVGADSVGASNEQQAALAEFGKQIGFMFQIINDWNNWSGFEEQIGRSRSDLDRGKMNHITLILEEGNSDRERVQARVRELVESHAAAAERALDQLGIENQYVSILKRMLRDKSDAWYWIDQDPR